MACIHMGTALGHACACWHTQCTIVPSTILAFIRMPDTYRHCWLVFSYLYPVFPCAQNSWISYYWPGLLPEPVTCASTVSMATLDIGKCARSLCILFQVSILTQILGVISQVSIVPRSANCIRQPAVTSVCLHRLALICFMCMTLTYSCLRSCYAPVWLPLLTSAPAPDYVSCLALLFQTLLDIQCTTWPSCPSSLACLQEVPHHCRSIWQQYNWQPVILWAHPSSSWAFIISKKGVHNSYLACPNW